MIHADAIKIAEAELRRAAQAGCTHRRFTVKALSTDNEKPSEIHCLDCGADLHAHVEIANGVVP